MLFIGIPLIIFFPFISHPLLIGLIVLLLTILISRSVGLITSNLWISYILVLVLLGGLLVIFIYVSLLVSNELFLKKSYFPLIFLFVYLLSLTLLLFNSHERERSSRNFTILETENNLGIEWLINFYSSYSSFLTVFLVLYLLLTLIAVVSVTKNDSSSLRRIK